MQINRRELYAKIWSIPIQRIAEELGTSCTAIHEACKRHQIPKPGRGHWRRVETGRSDPTAPLPDPAKDYPIQLPGGPEPPTVDTPRRTSRNSFVSPQVALAKPVAQVHEDRDPGPDPLSLLRRLPDPSGREFFLRALEEDVATRSPEAAVAMFAWIKRAKGAAVVLELIETVAEWGESAANNPPMPT